MGGAFVRQGFTPLFAADLDPRCVESYNLNHGRVAEVWDARKVKDGLTCQVLVAGPPCQGFSTLGRGSKAEERNRLSLLVAKWAITLKAEVVVVENVPQFLESHYWNALIDKLGREGYKSTAWTLDASEYGVAQKRIRSFTVLSRIGLPSVPKSSRKKLTVRDAFRGLSAKPTGRDLHIAPHPSELALTRFMLIPRNGDKRDILRKMPRLCPPSWAKMGPNATDVWGRMALDRPANTLRCCFQNPSKGRYVHPTQHRVITLREGARLQGIPDDWRFAGDRSSIARQIGNGVPVPLAEAVARAIKKLFI